MFLTVLQIENCQNAESLIAELQVLIHDRSDVTLETIVIHSEEEGRSLGFHGSPTILIDGKDPFPAPEVPVGLSCRRYPGGSDDSETVPGFPSGFRLRQALFGQN